ncbi:hypothetical protein A2971_03850 [Candidatus Gottesmanbacteria bacterium RIFCSPLOWO2_01_FULL_46_21]|uniref:Uncharacterized protein n=1 Tax=Candidatus Gottesmanbacteria bacterium RIFCSPLOWO2_01_FULL_46_21 TaxID=1798393 RepID=A0A1F6AXX0_9BACT|nr:MAG: hypothetical protein A2971_03850 [Candidatus Gottesmanbacteria bacterium RIFCSPLOWO2_01_FULL_46_21]
MITDADVKKLKESFKETFATKDDFSPIRKDISSIHKEIQKLRKAEETSAKYFDTVTTGHSGRLKTIEKHLSLPTPSN